MAGSHPSAIEELGELLSRLPGIGRRSARRLVFHLLKTDSSYCETLGESISTLRERVRPCSICGNYTDVDPCRICDDPRRTEETICVVTTTADLVAIEQTGTFRGRYHVLGGLLAPLDGVGPEDLRVDELIRRLKQSGVEEVILATPSTVEGEATASYLAELVRGHVERVSRIASGVLHGGELEYSDPVTLGRALDGRRDLERA
jgi:recombination protein RecR